MRENGSAGRVAVRESASILVIAAALLASASAIAAQQANRSSQMSDDERAAVQVVEQFFQGMLQRDTALLRSLIDPAARLVGTVTRDGVTSVRSTTMDQFIASIGRGPADQKVNERIFAPEVRIDGTLAQVWTFYTLHVNDRFSHCGYDAFHLLRTDAGWKVVNVADSRRTENCDPPASGRARLP